MNKYDLDWSDLAFSSKKVLRDLNAVFILAPREISNSRLTQIIKEYLPIGNIVFGCAKEKYIDGFNNQPQFKSLRIDSSNGLISKVNQSSSPHKITILNYNQPDVVHIFEKVTFKTVLLINGSWHRSFHTRPEYYTLVSSSVDFKFISPFASEDEAKKFADNFEIIYEKNSDLLTEVQMLALANRSATNSFDCSHQTGVAVGKKNGDKYESVMTSFNKVVPYQTFAWHFGAQREKHLSPPGDLNYYDAIHAEVMMLVEANRSNTDLSDLVLFINLLPCPTCARMLCESGISEIVYSLDHSEGYAVSLLESTGKKVRRLIDNDEMLKNGG